MANNSTMLQYFEWYLPDDGLLWRRVGAQAKAIREMGVTDVWLPPAYKGCSSADVGYGVYDLYDLGEFDQKGTVRTKYGTRKEYLNAVASLQSAGVRVYADIVLNHRMGGDEKETLTAIEDSQTYRTQSLGEPFPIEACTRCTFPVRNGKYSKFIWDHRDFSGTDFDASTGRSGIFRFAGKEWNTETDPENGNFDYLMGVDVDTCRDVVRREIVRWLRWYDRTAHPDGLRLDAVKHISFQDMKTMLAMFREQAGRKVPMVGEYWSSELERLTHYLEQVEHCMKLFDAPLHYRFFEAAKQPERFSMRALFDHTLVSAAPNEAVTFVDNHDTQPGQALESFIEAWFKPLAYAAILLREGGMPCVFYGDLYGIPYSRIEPTADLEKLMRIRRDYAYGAQTDYMDDDHIVGWTRAGDARHVHSGVAVLLSNGGAGCKRMYMGERFAYETFYDLLGRCVEPVTVDAEGWGTFGVPAGSVAVWANRGAYERMMIQA